MGGIKTGLNVAWMLYSKGLPLIPMLFISAAFLKTRGRDTNTVLCMSSEMPINTTSYCAAGSEMSSSHCFDDKLDRNL